MENKLRTNAQVMQNHETTSCPLMHDSNLTVIIKLYKTRDSTALHSSCAHHETANTGHSEIPAFTTCYTHKIYIRFLETKFHVSFLYK